MNDHDPPAEQPDPISEAGCEKAHSGHAHAWRGPLTLVLAFAAAITLIIAARPGGGAVTTTPNDAISRLGRVLPVPQRTVTPTLTGTTLTGSPLNLDSLRGHVVVVNFWGSWCSPCRAEAPGLSRLSKEVYGEGTRFVGVDIRDNQSAALAFESEFGITYPSVFDPGNASAAGFNPWPPVGTPTTYVIDTRGRIAAVFSGLARYTDLQPVVVQIVEHG